MKYQPGESTHKVFISWIFVMLVAPSSGFAQKPDRADAIGTATSRDLGTAVYNFEGNLECPTTHDSPVVEADEGVFDDFLRSGVDCAPGEGVFSSAAWPSTDVRVDTSYVGFRAQAPADAPFEFVEASQLSYSISRSPTGPREVVLRYGRDDVVLLDIATVTLDDTSTLHITQPLDKLHSTGSASKITFRFYAWGSTDDSGTLSLDDVSLSFAIATSAEERSELADEFTLDPAYPNPFRSTTTLPVVVGRTSRINVEIFDVLGRQRAVVYEGVLTQGRHQLMFDGENLPAGTYFIRVSTPRKQLLQKVVRVDNQHPE